MALLPINLSLEMMQQRWKALIDPLLSASNSGTGFSPGFEMSWPGLLEKIPANWLLCDGKQYKVADYPDLYDAIGNSHGGDGRVFYVPNRLGLFLRCVSGDSGRDPNATTRTAAAPGGNTGNKVGSIQANATAKNGLALTDPGHDHLPPHGPTQSNAGYALWESQNLLSATGISRAGSFATSVSTTGITLGAGDSETRPVNGYTYFIIKT